MWKYRLNDKILDIAIGKELIVFGCENGWIHVFDRKSHLWNKKLTSTYYRGPFTDVNVLSVDTNDKLVTVGTDFADGKVYVFSNDGKKIWEKQFISILGCWERPEDVTKIKLGDEFFAVSSEFMNSYIHVYTYDFDIVFQKELNGDVKAIEFSDFLVVGTDRRLYFIDYDGRIILSREINVRDVKVLGDLITITGDEKIIGYKNGDWWEIKIRNPIISVSDYIVAASGNRIFFITPNGEIISKFDVKDVIRCIYATKSNTYVGTESGLTVFSDFEISYEIRIGKILKIGEAGVLVVNGNTVEYYPFSSLKSK